MSNPILPLQPRVDIAATATPSNFVALMPCSPNAYRIYNKSATIWGNAYITTDAGLATVGSPPTFAGFTAIGYGTPIPPGGFIDYRTQVNQQVFGSFWMDSATATISVQPVNVS